MDHLPAFHHFSISLCCTIMWRLICYLIYSNGYGPAFIIMAYAKNVTGHLTAIKEIDI